MSGTRSPVSANAFLGQTQSRSMRVSGLDGMIGQLQFMTGQLNTVVAALKQQPFTATRQLQNPTGQATTVIMLPIA